MECSDHFDDARPGDAMYHHVLRITVFTRDPLLEAEIRNLAPLNRFSHEVRILKNFLPSALATSHIVLLDLPTSLGFKELRTRAMREARLICCMSPEEELKLTDVDVEALDDVWLKPLCSPRIRLRMKNILYEIKRDDDAKQHMIWLDTLIDSMPDLVWFKDLDGIHHKVNSKFCEFVNKSKENVEGATHSVIWNVPDDDADGGESACQQSENAAIETGTTFLADEIVNSGGEKHLLKTYKTPLKGPNGEILGTVGFAHDQTNLLNLDRELNFFIDSMPYPLALTHNDHKIFQVNVPFLDFFKVKKADIVGHDFGDWLEKNLIVETSPINGEEFYRFNSGNAKSRYVSLTRKNILDIFGKKVGSFKIFRDITAEKELEIRIWTDANTDSLTGMANRHAFSSYIKRLPKDSVIHLIYIDLDEFKAVNDLWGHKAGDEALRIVAKAIRQVFDQDFQVRLGGDEFLVLVQRETSLHDLENLAGTFLENIAQQFGSKEKLSKMSASIGIRAFGSISDSIDVLIRQADVAMYAAKAKGKAQYCIWTESMEEEKK